MRRRLLAITLIILAVASFDLGTKAIFCNSTCPPTVEIIPGVLWFTPALNPGAAFSVFADASYGNTLLLTISLGMVVWLLVLAFRQYREAPVWTFGLVVGGALGNIVDRLLPEGKVRDFIDLHWWPIFNLADVGISVGVFSLILWSLFFASRKEEDRPL